MYKGISEPVKICFTNAAYAATGSGGYLLLARRLHRVPGPDFLKGFAILACGGNQ